MSAQPVATPRPAEEVPTLGGRLPLLGHNLTLTFDVLKLLGAKDPDGPRLVRCSVVGSSEVHLWRSPEAFELLKGGQTTSLATEMGELVTGQQSMITSDGKKHRRLRKATSYPFTPKGLSMSGLAPIIADEVVKRTTRMAARDEVVLLRETQGVALDIIFRIMGIPEAELERWAARYRKLLLGLLGPQKRIPGLPHHAGAQAREWLDERLGGYIAQARAGELTTGLVAEFVRGRDDDGNALTDEEILDNLRLMVLAGHETTANTMAWMGAYLATEPGVWEAMVEEATRTDGLPMNPAEMSSYPYAEAFFRESLRLRPPVSMLLRRLTGEQVLEGFALPEGTVVGIPLWLSTRDAALYPEPERFDVSRWLDRSGHPSPAELAMFGAGAHFCLGYHMAWVESVQFILAWTRALLAAGKRPTMATMPEESYLTPYTIQPKTKMTRCGLTAGSRQPRTV